MLGLFSISSCDYSPHYFGKTRLIFWSSQNNNIFNLAIARANYGENDIRVETRIEKGLLHHFYENCTDSTFFQTTGIHTILDIVSTASPR